MFKILIITFGLAAGFISITSLHKKISVISGLQNIKYLFLPTSYLDAPRVTLNDLRSKYPIKEEVDDVKNTLVKKQKKTITIFVLGESARSGNFYINGYNRNTTPLLEEINPISYKGFYSCNTITKESVPCIFSHLSRQEFDRHSASSHENLIDILQKSGIQFLWRTNNGGCEGVCDRVQYEDFTSTHYKLYDEKLLYKLEEFIKMNQDQDLFIVLHQNGSHGPNYVDKYPEHFQKFNPVCSNSQLFQNCSDSDLTNAYDNTILYTNYFLSKVVSFLKEKTYYNTAMVYVSDHGESLGEGGIYMHCVSYFIAPI